MKASDLVGEPAAEPARPERHGAASGRVAADALARGPGLDAEPPEPDEPLGVGVAERVGRVVGGEPVVVEGDGAAPPDDAQDPGGRTRSRTSPVTWRWVSAMNASRACLSGENHMPS